jgi:hypothetical protein
VDAVVLLVVVTCVKVSSSVIGDASAVCKPITVGTAIRVRMNNASAKDIIDFEPIFCVISGKNHYL